MVNRDRTGGNVACGKGQSMKTAHILTMRAVLLHMCASGEEKRNLDIIMLLDGNEVQGAAMTRKTVVCIMKAKDRQWFIEPIEVQVCRAIPIAVGRPHETLRIIPTGHSVRIVGAYCRKHPTLLIDDPSRRFTLDHLPIATDSVESGRDILRLIMEAAQRISPRDAFLHVTHV